MTRIVLYVTYLQLLAMQVMVACYAMTQCKWNGWRKYGMATFFMLGAFSSISIAPAVWEARAFQVSLSSGSVFWLSIPRAIALTCTVYGFFKASRTPQEDVI